MTLEKANPENLAFALAAADKEASGCRRPSPCWVLLYVCADSPENLADGVALAAKFCTVQERHLDQIGNHGMLLGPSGDGVTGEWVMSGVGNPPPVDAFLSLPNDRSEAQNPEKRL